MKRNNSKHNMPDLKNNTGETNKQNSTFLERSEYTLELVNSWISNADTKVSISSGVFSVIVAVIVFVAENTLKNNTVVANPSIYKWFVCSSIFSAIAFLASEFFHLWAISPSFIAGKKHLRKNEEPGFSIFYDEIRLFRSAERYASAAREVTEWQYEDEVLKEVFYNSRICSTKMIRFKIGIWIGWGAIALTITSCILYYFSYVIH